MTHGLYKYIVLFCCLRIEPLDDITAGMRVSVEEPPDKGHWTETSAWHDPAAEPGEVVKAEGGVLVKW